MKTRVLFFIFLLISSFVIGQDVDIKGTWSMIELTWITPDGNQVTTEEQMKANGSVTDYFVMGEGKFKMTSNMSGSGTLDSYEGTWKLEGKKLTYTLTVNDRVMDVVWDFELKDNIMKLKRTSPDGSATVVNTFRKK